MSTENKLILNDLINAKESLDTLSNKELPIKISYKISKLLGAIQKELITFEQERNKLVRKYGNELNGEIKVTPDNISKFNTDYVELVAINVSITEDLIDINDIGEINISPKDMLLINKFIKDT